MANISDSALTVLADQIQNETTAGANTALRIGTLFNNLVDSKINHEDLDNVDNTSDVDKPVSTAQSAAIAAAVLPKVQYKCEIAYISQASTSAPTVGTLVKHDFSTTVVYTRSSMGVYLATITSSEFTSGKTIVLGINGTNGGGVLAVEYVNANNVQIVTRDFAGSLADGLLVSAIIKIEVYP